jgi:hypothetical protein
MDYIIDVEEEMSKRNLSELILLPHPLCPTRSWLIFAKLEEYIQGAEEILRIKELYQLLLSDRPYVCRYAANKIK